MRISDWSSDVCSSDLVAIERKIADRPQTGNLTAIVTAIDLARTLGADADARCELAQRKRSEKHTSELQSLMRISYAVFCWKNKKTWNYEKRNKQSQNKTTSLH